MEHTEKFDRLNWVAENAKHQFHNEALKSERINHD